MKKKLLMMFVLLLGLIGLQAQNCNPPTGLNANVHTPEWRDVSLSWTPVTDATQQTLGYGTTNSSSMSVGGEFTAVIRFTQSELAMYGSRYLTAVQFKPGMSQSECEYTLTIWQGGSVDLTDTMVDPGFMVRNQFITQMLETGSLNTVFLDTALAIDPNQELWIGVHARRLTASGFPIGASYNPSVNYKGNIVYNGSTWYLLNLSSQPNNTNWYMFAVLTDGAHLLDGYNVYRDNVLLTTTAAPSYMETLSSDGTYAYSVTAAYANGCESQAITTTVTMNDDCFISTLPYTENFDGLTGTTASTVAAHVLPDCWGWANHGATYPGYPVVYNSSSYASSGTNSLRFYTYNTSADNTTYADQYAILPPVDVNSHPINTLQMEFDAKCTSTTSTYQFFLEVGVMSSLSDVSTFVPVDTIQCTGNVYGNYLVSFSQYEGDGQYIAFRSPKLNTGATVYNTGVVDNIVLDIVPTCPKPTDLAIDDDFTTTSNLTLTWIENGSATEWEVEYGPAGFVPGNGTIMSTYTNPLTISDLSASTLYDFYVRSICAAGDTSHYSNVLSASTACGVLSTLPYTQNFDSYTGSTSGTTPNIDQCCWSQISTGTISSYAGYPLVYNNATYSNSGTNSLRFYTYYTATYGDEYAVMPPVDVTVYPMNTLQVEFAANKYSTYSLKLIVGVMNDSASVASFVPVDTIDIPTTAAANEYQTYIVSFENYTGTGNRVAFMAPRPSTSYNAGCIDDLILSTIPTCKKPMAVEATALTHESVTIDWTPYGDETAWDVAVVPRGSAIADNNFEYASEHPFTLSNLTESTNYDVYVRANCGSEVSPWSNVFTFKTRCAPSSVIPFAENFDSYPAVTAAASGVIPTCWEGTTNYSSSYPYIYSTQHASGTGSLYFYSTSAYYSKAISPALDLSAYAAGELALSFKALKTSAAYGALNVYAATNPYDESTYEMLKDIASSDYAATSIWTDFSVVLNNTYAQPIHLIFEAPASVTSYVCVDDILVDETPDCSSPRNVMVSNIHGTSAQVQWDAALFGANSYDVEYCEAGTESWSAPETVDGTRYLLAGLDPLTAYDVRVTSNCASGNADPVTASFHTVCLIPDDITIGNGTGTSYYIPFYGAYQYSYSQQLYTAAEMNNQAKDITTISFQYTGDAPLTRTVDIYLLNTNESSLASSWIPMTNAQLVYSGDVTVNANAGENNWNTILLDSVFHYDGYSNLLLAINNRSTVSGGTSATTKTFKYTSASGKARYVNGSSTTAIPYNPFNMTVAGTSYAYHNNIMFGSCDNSTTCAAPVVALADVTDESITLSWVPGYQENSWELEYKAQGDAAWTSEGVVTDSPYTISGLNTNTQYQFRMRSICSDTSTWAVVNARTYCVSINVPYTQDFETATGSGADNFIECWSRGTTSTTAYPYTSTTQAYSGSYGLYFYGTSSYYSYAATPRFDDSVEMDSLQIRFWARKSTATYNIQVGIMSNPADYNTFVPLATVTPNEINTWQELQVNTRGYAGNGRFVAFRIPNQVTSNMYIDDILIQYIPSCARVQDVTAVDLQANQTDITWTSHGESTWYYMYGPKDSVEFNINDAIATNVDTITLTNLLSNTEYDVFVLATCDNGEESEVVRYTFTTLCEPIASLPYRENFDNYGGSGSAYYPTCWYRHYVTTSTSTVNYPYIYSTYFNSAPSCLYMYGLTSTPSYSVAVMQPFTDNINLNTLQVDFTLRTATLSNYILVGVMTDPNDLNTFTVVDTAQCTSTGVFETQSVSLASYMGTGKYIAFKSSGSLYMDDVVVDYIPACDNPTDMTFSNVSQTGATIGWTAGSTEDSWEVYVVPAGNSILSEMPTVVNNNSFDISNLTAATTYDVYVRATCPDGFGHSGYLVATFTTLCYAIGTLPITENFDGVAGSTTGTVNNLPTCWNYYNTGTLSSYVGYPIVYNSSSYAASGSNSLRFYVYSASTYAPQYAILPEIDTDVLPINTLAVEFDMRKYSTSYERFVLEVGVMTDPAVDSTFEALDTVEVTSINYSRQVVYLNNYTGTGRYITLKAIQPATSYNAGQVDNLVVDLMPSCLRVNNVTASETTSEGMTISWEASGDESAWNVYYKPASDTIWQTVASNSTSVQLTGLTSNTVYNIQVVADCGGSQSAPSNTLTITTECEDMATIPYTENFDDYTATTSGTVVNIPACWHQMNLGYTSSTYAAYPIMYNSASYAYSGTNSMRFYTYNSGSTNYGDQWAIMRGIDTNIVPIQTLQLKFKARKYSASYPFNLTVGVMSDCTDTSTFVPVATVSPTDVEYEDHTVYFRHYTGGGKYIVLRAEIPASSYNAGYIDNLELSLAPSCLPVQNLEVTGITTNTIDIEWQPLGDESAWTVNYRSADDTTWFTDVATGLPNYQLSNLQPSSSYIFRVRPDCGGESAPWSNVVTATTSCVAVDALPYSENFDSYVGTIYSTSGPVPTCWDTYTDNESRPAPHVIGSGSYWYPQSTPNALSFVGGSPSTNAIAVLPEFTAALNTLQISFAYRMESAAQGTLKVGYVTDVANPNGSFVEVATINNTTTITNDTVDFSAVTGSGRIAFKWSYTGTSFYNCNVDNVVVDLIPETCNEPTNLAVTNVTNESATVNWTAGGDETAWNLQFKKASASVWSSSVLVQTTPIYALTGLTDNTEYQVRVQAVCDSTATSDWVVANFTTLEEEPCAVPTNLTATNVQNESVTLTWNQEANTADQWTVKYREQGSNSWNTTTATAVPYTLSGLTGRTTYEILVMANCSNGSTSDPSNIITVTTTNVGVSDYDLNSVVVYPNPTDGQFRIENSEMTIERVEVYDVYGKLMNMVEVKDTQVTMNISSYAAGTYFVRVYTESGMVTKRIVKR